MAKKETTQPSTEEQRFPVLLGCKAQDKITGFTGIVVCMSYWLNGCVRVTIQPEELRDGKPVEAHTFDIEQLRCLLPKAEPESGGTGPAPGGPSIPPARRPEPTR